MLPRAIACAAAITSGGANVFRVFGINGQWRVFHDERHYSPGGLQPSHVQARGKLPGVMAGAVDPALPIE